MLRPFAARRLSPLSSPPRRPGKWMPCRQRVNGTSRLLWKSVCGFWRKLHWNRRPSARKKKKDLWEVAFTQMSLSRNHFNFCFHCYCFKSTASFISASVRVGLLLIEVLDWITEADPWGSFNTLNLAWSWSGNSRDLTVLVPTLF